MSYETAPATALVATCCACCGKDLVDAESVQTGMGPYCRKSHGYAKPEAPADWAAFHALLGDGAKRFLPDGSNAEDARGIANRVVYAIAAKQTGAEVTMWTRALAALGFVKLATRIAERLGGIRVKEENGKLYVKTPFNDAFRMAMRGLGGAVTFDPTHNIRIMAASDAMRRTLWRALCAAFPGCLVIGTKGIAVAEQKSARAA